MARVEVAALLFDADGVLLDSRPVVERTWRRWAARHGLAADPILRVAHGRRTWDTLRAAAPHLAIPEEVAWLDAAELQDFEGIVPIPGASALVASLPQPGWTVVTSAGRTLAAKRLASVGLSLPDRAVTSEDVQNGKPAPDGYVLAALRLGVRPADCLVVEDAPPGVEAGLAAGARVLALTTTHSKTVLASADYVVPDLRAVRLVAARSALMVEIDLPE